MSVPPDLSRCSRCGRPVPPSNRPQFADWKVVKDDGGRVSGMLCPECQSAEAESAQTG